MTHLPIPEELLKAYAARSCFERAQEVDDPETNRVWEHQATGHLDRLVELGEIKLVVLLRAEYQDRLKVARAQCKAADRREQIQRALAEIQERYQNEAARAAGAPCELPDCGCDGRWHG